MFLAELLCLALYLLSMVTFLETSPMAENNMRELYEIYLELGHEVFEEKIKKPMEIYLHNNHDSSNVISIHSLNTIISNAMESSKLGEVGFDKNDIFSSPNLEEEECYTFECHDSIEISPFDKFEVNNLLDSVKEEIAERKNVLPNIIYDNALDDGPILPNDINYTIIVKSGFDNPTISELNKNYAFIDHDKNVLCDIYTVESIHDATENYFERGKYGYRNLHVIKFPLFMMKVLSFLVCNFYMLVALRPNGHNESGRHNFIYLNNIKSPLFMLKVLKLHLFCLPMLVTLCFTELFSYKAPMHRKSVRFKHVLYMLLDALFYVSTLIFM